MQLTPKTKGVIIVVVFIAILILPASYGLIRALLSKPVAAHQNDSVLTAPKK